MADSRSDQPDERRIYEAIQAAKQPDSPGYRGETTREYQKELGKQIIVRGRENAIGGNAARESTDLDIAARLLAAGHHTDEIQNSLAKASPQASIQHWKEQPHIYSSNIMASVLQNKKAMAKIEEVQIYAINRGLDKERRLEHVEKLATPIKKKSQQKANEQERPR